MAEIVSTFIIPLVKTFVYVLFFGGFAFYLFRYIYIKYTRKWKWAWKYLILRKKYSETDLKWVMECVDRDYNTDQVKKLLLLGGIMGDRFYETIWIFRKVYNQMKGGVKNGRNFKGCDSKTQSTAELPKFNSKSNSK